jgi:hypothetical protein
MSTTIKEVSRDAEGRIRQVVEREVSEPAPSEAIADRIVLQVLEALARPDVLATSVVDVTVPIEPLGEDLTEAEFKQYGFRRIKTSPLFAMLCAQSKWKEIRSITLRATSTPTTTQAVARRRGSAGAPRDVGFRQRATKSPTDSHGRNSV